MTRFSARRPPTIRLSTVRFLLMRLGALIGLLLLLSLLMFVLQRVSGQDPVSATMGRASAAAKAAARHRLGLDQPAPEQYLHYLAGLLHLDLGTSYRTHHTVLTDITTYLAPSVELIVCAAVLAVLLAVVFAVSSVLHWPGSSIYRGLLYLGHTAPTFMLGIVAIILLYQDLGWLPAAGQVNDASALPPDWHWVLLDSVVHGQPAIFVDAVRHLVMPALALAIGPALAVGRILRSSILTTLDSDYVRTARAKGLSEWRVITRHVLRNSLNGALSMAGLQVGFMFGGVLVIESVFSRPGLGSYLDDSLAQADFPAVAGVTFVLASCYVMINTVVDLLQALADPRIAR